MKPVVVGDCTLYRGDCLGLLDRFTDVTVITDPPYGIALSNHEHGNVRRRKNSRADRSCHVEGDGDLSAANAVADWADKQKLCTAMFCSPYAMLPGKWRNVLVWDKGGGVGMGGDPPTCWARTIELVLVRHNPPLNGKRDQAVLRYWVGPNQFALHPCQKPVKLLRYLIGKLTQPGDVVFDPFMGSGSTGVACLLTGRKFIGIEKDSNYFDIAVERLRHRGHIGRRKPDVPGALGLFGKPPA